jgi:mono/diheme cytochrome c family protein
MVGIVATVSPNLYSAEKNPVWATQMRSIEKTLNELLFDLSNETRFNDPKNFSAIDRNAEKFAVLARELNEKVAAPDKDPSLREIGDDFAKDARAAATAMKAGNRAYARVMLNASTGYCIACHTRNSSGPQFSALKIDARLDGMKPLEKADYLTATRNFDQAFLEYEKILKKSESGVGEAFLDEKAVRGALGIAIRVKHDPDLALALVNSLAANSKSPYFIRERAGQWKKSILEWKASAGKKASGESAYEEALKLIAEGKATQKFPVDRSADVLYLRASSLVHDLLSTGPKGPLLAKANYLAGLTYEVLDDYGIRNFNEYYYRACVRADPHTILAQECYRRYEESVYFGYTGSGGTYIPADVRARLSAVELLSVPPNGVKASETLQ